MRASVLVAVLGAAAAQTTPVNSITLDSRACQPPFDTLPFCNTGLSIDERVDDLIERLWAQANASIPEHLTARNMGKNAVPVLGLPEYDWGLNCIHGVQSSCVLLADSTTVCPTSFMNPVNYGATWNKSFALDLGTIVGTEARALWLAGAVEEFPRNHIGLDCWSPNINIARDPRWGRNQEVGSEDPLINGDFGSQYTQGLQYPAGGDPGHLKVAVTLKHWDAYSLENSDGFTRNNFNAVVSNYAFATTYFPAFQKSVVEGKATGVMCSYNAVNGVPTCASPFLTKVLRDTWGFQGYVTSDSGALENIHDDHKYTNSSIASVPVALRDGQTDVCSGGIYSGYLLQALEQGLVQREDVDLALRHTLTLRMTLGLFDPPAATPYWSVPTSAIGTAASTAANLLATQSSMVLLKNSGNTLPFPVGRSFAIIGPHANATLALVGNYLGQVRKPLSCALSPLPRLTHASSPDLPRQRFRLRRLPLPRANAAQCGRQCHNVTWL
jgi:beta-D-xylosidase 4